MYKVFVGTNEIVRNTGVSVYARCYVGGNNIKINTLLYISGNTKLTKMVYSRQTTSEERALMPFFAIISSRNREETDRSPATIMKLLRGVRCRSFHRFEDENTSLRRGRR